jgi:hypothetical protein
MDLKETGREGVQWIKLAQYRVQRWDVMMNLWVLQNTGNFLTSWVTINLQCVMQLVGFDIRKLWEAFYKCLHLFPSDVSGLYSLLGCHSYYKDGKGRFLPNGLV